MESYGPKSKVIIEAANITLYSGAEVNSGYTLLSANETIQMMEGTKIASLRENTCNMDPHSSDLFVCIKPYSLKDELTTEHTIELYKE